MEVDRDGEMGKMQTIVQILNRHTVVGEVDGIMQTIIINNIIKIPDFVITMKICVTDREDISVMKEEETEISIKLMTIDRNVVMKQATSNNGIDIDGRSRQEAIGESRNEISTNVCRFLCPENFSLLLLNK
jgi:hypothetical protein